MGMLQEEGSCKIHYFDSFGNLQPPIELMRYFGDGVNVYYNYNQHQEFNTVIGGHLCLKFLTKKD